MGYFDEDYYEPGYFDEDYYEPSEFEIQVDEFKDTLRKSVKQEIQNELERLRIENESLKEVKNNFNEIKREYERKKRELETEKQNLASQVRRERLSNLFKDFRYYLYYATKINQPLPKCNNCDVNGYIHFTSPSGKDCKEWCKCREGEPLYIPKEWYCCEFKFYYHNRDKLITWYSETIEKDKDDYYKSTQVPKDIYDGEESYEEIEKHGYYYTYFQTIEDCQKYCDWLNEKHGFSKVNYVVPKKS